jgi:hypothetical protein
MPKTDAQKISQKLWRQKNKETIKQYKTLYDQQNKEKVKEYHKNWHQINKENINQHKREKYKRLTPEQLNERRIYRTSPFIVCNEYQRSAKRRGYEWNLNLEQVTFLIESACFYCGRMPDEKKNGIDRFDNEKGYDSSNIVPCCTACNTSKMTDSAEEYIARCIKVVENWKSIEIK